MLTPEELENVKQYVLRELPRILEQDPGFVLFVEGIVSEKFPRRDEFSRALDEFTGFRQEVRESFQEVKEQFEEVDQRFEQVDQRFEQVDRRFEQVDRRFEQVDRRFEQVDRRFEQVDQRFEGVDQRLDRIEGKVDALSQEMRDLRDWVELIGGPLQARPGRNMEDVVAGALRLGLGRPDVDPRNVRLRQVLRDTEGHVFKAGKEKEVDIVAQDGELLVFEVESAPKRDDVDEFADKVELVRFQNPEKKVTGVFVVLGAEQFIKDKCRERGLRLIPDR